VKPDLSWIVWILRHFYALRKRASLGLKQFFIQEIAHLAKEMAFRRTISVKRMQLIGQAGFWQILKKCGLLQSGH
jgi:hypothetical protein